VRRPGLAAAALALVAGCAELVGTAPRSASFSIVPVFNVADPYAVAATTADSLQILVIQKNNSGVFADTIVRVTAAIDPDSGTASTTLTVPLLTSPQSFVILLRALRSSDGLVLFSGLDTIQVQSSGQGMADSIPITYTGPRAARLTIAPKDTAVTGAAVIPFRVTAFDSSNAVVSGVYVSFFLVDRADSSKLTLGKYTGVASGVSGASGQVRVYALAPGGVSSDTASVILGSAPAGVKVTPGYADLAVGDTLTLVGQMLDFQGNPISGSVTWQTRSPSVATIGTTGRVTGAAPGAAVLVASGSGVSDSALVVVAVPTNAIMSATSAGSAFRQAAVGDTVVVDLTADLRFTPGELLGSYQASLDWDATVLQFIDVQSTAFAAPVVNAGTGTCGHQLCLAAADPQNATSNVVVARVRLLALKAGSTATTLGITELSSDVAPTFTNLYAANRVTVTSGSVTVRP
jgi:hypothetical protein